MKYTGHYEGDLIINKGDDVSELTSVSGRLSILAEAQLPALTSVGGGLGIRAEAQLPALTSVGGLPLPSAEVAETNLRIIAPLALVAGCLKMSTVHTCDTVHCIAGWAAHVLPGGKELEGNYNWSAIGIHFLGLEAAKHFFDNNESGRKFLEQFV